MNLKTGMEILEIIQPGVYSSVQDAGRFGQRGYAIPQSGCLDSGAQYLANHLVGNSSDEAVVETIGGRFECRILEAVSLGIVGSAAKVNGTARLLNETIFVQENDVIQIEGSELSYLAISRGITGQSHFGSVSTYPLAKLGGLNGNLLKKGDRISTMAGAMPERKQLPEQVLPKLQKAQVIRILKGPEFERLAIESSDLEERNWKISPQSNRMGIRLAGDVLKTKQAEMTPVPTFPGTVQLTNEGLPIVLLNDAQTTGGYPRMGQVIRADRPRLARMILGGSIKFKFVDIFEARYILKQKEAFLKHAFK